MKSARWSADLLLESSGGDHALADVLDQYVQALERGAAPSLAELQAAHPELADVLPEYVEGVQAVHAALGSVGEAAGPPLLPERKQLGDFRIVGELGRGGMGVVYEARQLSLNRRVALKVLPFAAVLDERQISRFRTEAQAAAGLHHPHIVPVFAVGQERGLHYYAMQLIEGQSVAQALAELRQKETEPAPVAQGAETDAIAGAATTVSLRGSESVRSAEYFRTVAQLGVQAAEALHHAHQFGVIHRDVKPSNLLLDRQGKLWVTDFGLARIQSNASVTLSGDIVGTLRYMSPEQAQGRADLVDGRTDVYSLGATLYELATLRPAHPGEDPQSLARWIAQQEPTPPARLNPAIPADLETIILRAMGKNREDRYATAQQLADDLQRFLEGRPTLARRPGVVDRVGKWIARRRGAAVAAAAALVAITVVSVASALWVGAASRRTAAALAQAEQNLDRAEFHYRQARSVVDHFGGQLADRLAEFPGAESLRQALLADTLRYYGEFLATVGDDPQLTGELAATHFKSAAIAERLGDLATARDNYQQAVAAWKTANDHDGSEPGANVALALAQLARIEGQLGEWGESARLFEEAIAGQRAALQADPNDAAAASILAESLSNRGQMVRRSQGAAAGIDDMREAARLFTLAARLQPAELRHVRALAVAKNNLCEALRETSLDEALVVCREAAELFRQLAAMNPHDQRSLADLAMAGNNLAALHAAAGDLPQALAGYDEATDALGKLVDRNPLQPGYRRELAIVQCNRGLCLARLDRPDESTAAFDAAQGVLETLAADFPDQVIYRTSLAALWNNRGVAWQALGESDRAVAAFAEAVAVQEALLSEGLTVAGAEGLIEKHYRNYAGALREAGQADAAAAVEHKLAALPEPPGTPAARVVTPASRTGGD